ncbi:cbb3-type cytochrome c oxidase subunit I, partial [Pseudoxanthobacter sp.]|uniref:cbb3-type cytochrome c oxidase subunit I n=1 Tax=Pseudoxanthobacter sp. TaxID=1925742 RepID=UPI002FE005E4
MPRSAAKRPVFRPPAPAGGPARLRRRAGWSLFSRDHKAVGTLNLVFAILAGLIGAALSLLIRAELQAPGLQFFADDATFGVFVSIHGLVMVLLMVMPALIGGFGNWFVPIMIGAPDMAFPRLNVASFWLLPPAMGLMLVALFAGPGFVRPSTLALCALGLVGLSSVMQAINFITTIVNLRAPGTGFNGLPLFVWSVLVTAFVLLVSWPVVAGAVTFLLLAPPAGLGDDPARLRQVTWFIAHPEIYVLILPGLGVVSQVVATFARRPVRGALWVAYAMVALGLAGFFLWARHLYGGGMVGGLVGETSEGWGSGMKGYFLLAALVVALPAFVQIAAWGLTMLSGGIRLTAPMLWALGFIVLLTIGAVTGVELAGAGLSGTGGEGAQGVAHFHYVLSLSAVFAIFAGWYFW